MGEIDKVLRMVQRKKILIINVNWIGDVIFSTPFIRAVRAAYPQAFIACLVHPRCAEMLKGSPRLDEVIIYDEEGIHKSLAGKLRLIAALRKRRFDTAFMLHRSFTKAAITLLALIRERIGYPTKHRGIVLTNSVELRPAQAHKVEYFLDIARAAGIKVDDASYEFFIRDGDRKVIDDFLRENNIGEKKPFVVLCPGGNWDPKRWPAENFAVLGDMLAERAGLKVVISGSAKDAALADSIKNAMRHDAVISCSRTSLKTLGALFERSSLVVANDTGPMHLAVAMKANVVALFGPTSPDLTGPYGNGNYRVIWKMGKNSAPSRPETVRGCEVPCYDFSCTGNRCMALITPEDVFKEAREMLSKAGINADK